MLSIVIRSQSSRSSMVARYLPHADGQRIPDLRGREPDGDGRAWTRSRPLSTHLTVVVLPAALRANRTCPLTTAESPGIGVVCEVAEIARA
jgi:hypothetical protein